MSRAIVRDGGTLTAALINEDHRHHETHAGLCVTCSEGTVRFQSLATAVAANVFFQNSIAPNGYDLINGGGTFNLFRGASASSTPATILQDNGNTGGDPPPGTNVFPGTPSRVPPEVNVTGTITAVNGTPTPPNPVIP